mmetsp:Transcript_153294/g.471589  ORF Transcript_153294/g.471589 Transcript_153294/m.471589 type:complete len:228 (-) Transcript_153294:154-837(-)
MQRKGQGCYWRCRAACGRQWIAGVGVNWPPGTPCRRRCCRPRERHWCGGGATPSNSAFRLASHHSCIASRGVLSHSAVSTTRATRISALCAPRRTSSCSAVRSAAVHNVTIGGSALRRSAVCSGATPSGGTRSRSHAGTDGATRSSSAHSGAVHISAVSRSATLGGVAHGSGRSRSVAARDVVNKSTRWSAAQRGASCGNGYPREDSARRCATCSGAASGCCSPRSN